MTSQESLNKFSEKEKNENYSIIKEPLINSMSFEASELRRVFSEFNYIKSEKSNYSEVEKLFHYQTLLNKLENF